MPKNLALRSPSKPFYRRGCVYCPGRAPACRSSLSIQSDQPPEHPEIHPDPGSGEWQKREPSKAQGPRSGLPVDEFAIACSYLAAKLGFSRTKLECALDSKAGSSRVLSEGRWFPSPAGGVSPS